MDNVEKLQKDIVEYAILWGNAIKIGDHRSANKQNNAVTRIAKKFKKNKNLGELVLIPLLKHHNPSVRLLASVNALYLEIHTQEAEVVLSKVAGDPNIHVIQLMAKINLQMWNEKKRGPAK